MRSVVPCGVMMATALVCAVCLLTGGCDSSQDTTVYQRQDQALKDPMNYSVNMDDTDITGGPTAHYDPKAMKRDVDDVVNP